MVFTLEKEFSVKSLIVLLATLFLSLNAHSVTIEFPEEELAKESVLPVFEGGTTAVKSRRVVTKGRFEVGPMGGFIFNEPYFNPMTYGLHAGYHFNEFHSVALNAFLRNDGLSSDAEELDKTFPPPAKGFNFKAMPAVKYLTTLDYQLTPYYGKISLSKDLVMNLTLYVYGGAGIIDIDGDKTWIANIGVGQNLFFTSRFGLRMDLKFLMYNGPNYTSIPAKTKVATGTVPASEFEKQFNFSPSIMIGAVVLL